MDIFEELFTSLNENIDIFKKYSMKKENGIAIPADKEEDFDIEGKNILPSEKVKEFLQVRSIYYWNIVNKKLKDYSLPEWLACLEESVLLEYAIPIFSRVIQEYPML